MGNLSGDYLKLSKQVYSIMQKNAFAAIFLLNALLTLLFGYFLYVLTGNF